MVKGATFHVVSEVVDSMAKVDFSVLVYVEVDANLVSELLDRVIRDVLFDRARKVGFTIGEGELAHVHQVLICDHLVIQAIEFVSPAEPREPEVGLLDRHLVVCV